MWCVLAARHPAPDHGYRTTHYQQYVSEIRDEGISWPIPFSQINKFERMNRFFKLSKLSF